MQDCGNQDVTVVKVHTFQSMLTEPINWRSGLELGCVNPQGQLMARGTGEEARLGKFRHLSGDLNIITGTVLLDSNSVLHILLHYNVKDCIIIIIIFRIHFTTLL